MGMVSWEGGDASGESRALTRDASGCVFVGRFRSFSAVSSSARGFFALLRNIYYVRLC
jgi:hypothetical protein